LRTARGATDLGPARQGRNPSTGETIEIAAARKLGFAPAKQAKVRLGMSGRRLRRGRWSAEEVRGEAVVSALAVAPLQGKSAIAVVHGLG
jgi:hypothetical protein